MAGERTFRVEGIIIAVHPNGTHRVGLANGQTLLGFYSLRGAKQPPVGRVGDTVKVQLTPYDLSQGRILVETEQI